MAQQQGNYFFTILTSVSCSVSSFIKGPVQGLGYIKIPVIPQEQSLNQSFYCQANTILHQWSCTHKPGNVLDIGTYDARQLEDSGWFLVTPKSLKFRFELNCYNISDNHNTLNDSELCTTLFMIASSYARTVKHESDENIVLICLQPWLTDWSLNMKINDKLELCALVKERA